jgi:hypothetical protein
MAVFIGISVYFEAVQMADKPFRAYKMEGLWLERRCGASFWSVALT